MEEKVIIKIHDEKIKEKLKLIRKSNINITDLICSWILEYTIK